MLQIEILSGKKAGQVIPVRRFPFQVGRSTESDLTLIDWGVWKRHFAIHQNQEGFVLVPEKRATVFLNGKKVEGEVRLRPGDEIGIGTVKLCVGFSPVQQQDRKGLEIFVWGLVVLIGMGELLLMFLLPR